MSHYGTVNSFLGRCGSAFQYWGGLALSMHLTNVQIDLTLAEQEENGHNLQYGGMLFTV